MYPALIFLFTVIVLLSYDSWLHVGIQLEKLLNEPVLHLFIKLFFKRQEIYSNKITGTSLGDITLKNTKHPEHEVKRKRTCQKNQADSEDVSLFLQTSASAGKF